MMFSVFGKLFSRFSFTSMFMFLLFFVAFSYSGDTGSTSSGKDPGSTPTYPSGGGGGADALSDALNSLCCSLQGLIPVTAMLLVITAGVVYSAGQMFGAETRARANVWATSCLTGAIIGILIAQIAPSILGLIAGTDISCVCT